LKKIIFMTLAISLMISGIVPVVSCADHSNIKEYNYPVVRKLVKLPIDRGEVETEPIYLSAGKLLVKVKLVGNAYNSYSGINPKVHYKVLADHKEVVKEGYLDWSPWTKKKEKFIINYCSNGEKAFTLELSLDAYYHIMEQAEVDGSIEVLDQCVDKKSDNQ
jgi:hypothetical protein